MDDQTYVVKQYKDTVFRLLFKDKDKLLELYNAVNNSHHTNSEDLEVVTLENAVYMSMKNDISCLLDMRIQLYEHQSTVNPNMPLRDLIRQYRKTYPLTASVQMAVDYCIEHGILRDFLLANKAEVVKMSIFEYDEELHAKYLREEGREEGYKDGRIYRFQSQRIGDHTDIRAQTDKLDFVSFDHILGPYITKSHFIDHRILRFYFQLIGKMI